MTAALRLVASGVLLGLARVRANVCGTWVDDALCMGTISRDSPTHYGSTTSPGYSITGNAASDHFYILVIDDELKAEVTAEFGAKVKERSKTRQKL